MNLFLSSSISTVAKDIFPKAFHLARSKKLIFIPTAGEVEAGPNDWLEDDRRSLAVKAGFEVSIYSITGKTESEVRAAFAGVGTVCINGGNTYHLLHQARLSSFDKVIRELVAAGVIYVGSSAGAIIAGPNMETLLDPKVVKEMSDFSGFQLTDLSVRPHWGSLDFGPVYGKEMQFLSDKKLKIVLITDNQYVHVKDDWYQIKDVSK